MSVKLTELKIEKLSHGGFVVSMVQQDFGRFAGPLFACADIDDALAFIKDQLCGSERPESGKASPEINAHGDIFK